MKNKLLIGAFCVMLAAFAALLALPADKKSIEAENRAMTEMPALNRTNVFSGKFASQFEEFIGDNIAFRSALTAASRQLDGAKGITPHDGAVISTTKDIGTGSTIKMTLLFTEDAVMEMYRKNSATEKMYTDAVNLYAEKLPENIELYNMLIPTQLEFQKPIYKNLQDSQSEAIEEMYAKLSGRVKTVNVLDTMKEHMDEYIYLRSDHHWTPLGAYYAYREFMLTEGSHSIKNTDYEKHEIKGFLGYLYDRVNTPGIAKQPDTIEWYDVDKEDSIDVKMHKIVDGELVEYDGVMYEEEKQNYSFFFGSDHPIVEMTNRKNAGGKTIVVIKDSYANAFAPWLITSYGKVVLVDPRIYKGSFDDILKKFEPDEVLIMNYIFTTSFPDYCDMLKNLYK